MTWTETPKSSNVRGVGYKPGVGVIVAHAKQDAPEHTWSYYSYRNGTEADAERIANAPSAGIAAREFQKSENGKTYARMTATEVAELSVDEGAQHEA